MTVAEKRAEGGEEGFKLFRQFSAGNFFAKSFIKNGPSSMAL